VSVSVLLPTAVLPMAAARASRAGPQILQNDYWYRFQTTIGIDSKRLLVSIPNDYWYRLFASDQHTRNAA
jgi:hypothetical protein